MAAAHHLPTRDDRLQIARRVEADAHARLEAAVQSSNRVGFELQRQQAELVSRGVDVVNDALAARALAPLRGDAAQAQMAVTSASHALETARRAVSEAERDRRFDPLLERASLERVLAQARPLVGGLFGDGAERSLHAIVDVLVDANRALATLHTEGIGLELTPIDATPVVAIIAAECRRRGVAVSTDDADVLRNRLQPGRATYDRCAQGIQRILQRPAGKGRDDSDRIVGWVQFRDWGERCDAAGIPILGFRRRPAGR